MKRRLLQLLLDIHVGARVRVMMLWAVISAILMVQGLRAQSATPAPVREIVESGLVLRIEGADAANWRDLESLLTDQLSLSGNTEPSEPLADDLAFFTRQHYVRNGWPKAEVRWEVLPDAISLTISAGYQIRVGDITWSGDVILPTEELRKFLLRLSIEKDGADKQHPVWVDSELQGGVGFVLRRMRAEGYLQAKVTMKPDAEPKANGWRDISMTLKAGPRFLFGTVNLTGAPPELEKLMLEETNRAPGGSFSEASVQNIERRLTSIARERGYLKAVTTSEYVLGSKGGTVDVVLKVQAGDRIRIAQVTPHPDFSKGSKRVLRAGFQGVQGQYYSSADLDLMFRRALDTGMFARLDMEPEILPPEATGGVPYANLRLTGEETKPKTLGFEIGFDTYLGAQAGVTYRNTNLWDYGNTLAAEVTGSTVGLLGSVKITDPAIFNTLFASTVQLAVENFSRFEYSRNGSTLNWELVRRVSVPFSYTLFVGASANDVTTDVLTPAQLGPDSYALAYGGLSMMLDFRNSVVLPTKGWFFSGRLESASDVASSHVGYLRTELRAGWYQPITKKLRIAAAASLRTLQGASAEELPIDSRVFNGGPNSVRSFSERELGPMTGGGTPLGGTSAFYSNIELSYEIYRNLEFAVFTDFGSLGRDNNSSPIDISSDIRTAVGVGLRYRLPFGPIRLDYGHNVDRRRNEPMGTVHLTIGFAF
jgi:outer membrane protein assembly factor BamA